MAPERFEHLLSLVRGKITKRTTNFRTPTPADHRFALTLRFFATGETQQLLSFTLRIRRTTVSDIISETCEAIYDSLKDTYL